MSFRVLIWHKSQACNGMPDMTSELSGIPLVRFFRTLHHILEPEFGETRLWLQPKPLLVDSWSDLAMGYSVSDDPGTRNFPFSPRYVAVKSGPKYCNCHPTYPSALTNKTNCIADIYHDQPRLPQFTFTFTFWSSG